MQCVSSAGKSGDREAARPAGFGVPEEGVLVLPDPLTWTQDAQYVGSLENPRVQRRGLGILALPKRDSRD